MLSLPEDKLFFTISEVAEYFNVNASLIRFWEKEFQLIKPQKNKKGNRLFTRKDIENIRLIYHLVKEKGFTLQGAKEKLKADNRKITQTTEAIDSLNRVRTFLVSLREQLDADDEKIVSTSNPA
jgi:DNA-binding transcriptional MerR regulator